MPRRPPLTLLLALCAVSPALSQTGTQDGANENGRETAARPFDGVRVVPSLPGRALTVPPAQPVQEPASERLVDRLFPLLFSLARSLPAASAAWPGYDPTAAPLLAVTPRGAVLVNHPNPPPEFRPVTVENRVFYVARRGPDIGGSWRVDYPFAGASITAVSGDADELSELAVHERFHVYQRRWTHPRRPAEPTGEDPADTALARAEHAAVLRWLESGDRDGLKDFLAARARRESLFPWAAEGCILEQLEGTAFYTQLRSRHDEAGTRARLTEELRRPVPMRDIPRWRHYDLGASLCTALEALSPGSWQRELEGGKCQAELLGRLLAVPAEELSRRADALIATPAHQERLRTAQGEVAALRRRREEALRTFHGLPGTRLRLLLHDDSFYHSGEWIDLPGGANLFPPERSEMRADNLSHNFHLERVWLKASGDGTTSTIELVLPQGARVSVDGRRGFPADGPFRELTIRGRGIGIAADGGSIRREGDVVVVEMPSGERPDRGRAPRPPVAARPQ